MEKIIKLIGKFNAGISALVTVIICVMVAMVTVAVFLRYVMGVTFQWMEEVSCYMQIIMVLLMAGPIFFKEDHINMDILFSKLKGRAHKIVELVNLCVSLYVAVFIFIKSLNWIGRTYRIHILTNSGYFEAWQPATLVPIGFFITVVYVAVLLIIKIGRFNRLDERLSDSGETGVANI